MGSSEGNRPRPMQSLPTRGDVPHSTLAEGVGASLDNEGQIIVDADLRTTVPGLYAAGCVTAANCQMIIAAGQGAAGGQAINRDLFESSLQRHALPRWGTDDRSEEAWQQDTSGLKA